MDHGPQNVIQGDYGTELPETKVDEKDLVVEKNAAKFSKTKEFQALKDHLEQRIEYYQTQLPDGRPLTQAKTEDWIVANLVIAEFKAVLDFYEQANQAVSDANRV